MNKTRPPDADGLFAGSIPKLYERYLVPLIFESYAADLASRVALRQPVRVLEVAAGTGVVTRQLAKALPSSVSICASDPRGEIEARGGSRLVEATEITTAAIANRFGSGPVDGKIQAHIVTIET